jgi:hypothetical protein
VWAAVPMIGSGTAADPFRPKYLPAPAPDKAVAARRDGIIAFSYTLSDDGKTALVQLVAHGNLTQMQIYDYGNLTTPVRTYTNTYVYAQTGKQAYAATYLFNRLYTSTMSDGTHTVTLTTNSYDGGTPQNVSSPGLHDAAYSTTFTVRGNLTSRTTLQGNSTSVYDITGVPLSTNTNGLSMAYTPDTATNSVPTTITPNGVSSLTTTLVYGELYL